MTQDNTGGDAHIGAAWMRALAATACNVVAAEAKEYKLAEMSLGASACCEAIRAIPLPTDSDLLTALAVERDAANARADKARDAALVEAAKIVQDNQILHTSNGGDLCPRMEGSIEALAYADAILALRDNPAPGVTPKIEVKFTWAKGDEEFWVHLKSPDGKSAGFNLGNPKGMIATALLRAIAGGWDE